jgi:hypothetical protein
MAAGDTCLAGNDPEGGYFDPESGPRHQVDEPADSDTGPRAVSLSPGKSNQERCLMTVSGNQKGIRIE